MQKTHRPQLSCQQAVCSAKPSLSESSECVSSGVCSIGGCRQSFGRPRSRAGDIAEIGSVSSVTGGGVVDVSGIGGADVCGGDVGVGDGAVGNGGVGGVGGVSGVRGDDAIDVAGVIKSGVPATASADIVDSVTIRPSNKNV